MQTMEFTRKGDYVPHPAGEWRAQLIEWGPDNHQEFGLQCKIVFQTEVADEKGEARKITVWCKPSLHPKGKIFAMLGAMGVDPNAIPEEQLKAFSLDPYVGKRLRLSITNEPKESDPKVTVDRVKAFLPYAKAAVKTAAGFDDEPEAAPAPAPEPKKARAAAATPPAPTTPEPDWDAE